MEVLNSVNSTVHQPLFELYVTDNKIKRTLKTGKLRYKLVIYPY